MTLDPKLLEILVCPEDHSPVQPATEQAVAALNTKIDQRDLRNRAGQVVNERIDGGLIRADGKYLYPVRRDIPVMLIDEALPLK